MSRTTANKSKRERPRPARSSRFSKRPVVGAARRVNSAVRIEAVRQRANPVRIPDLTLNLPEIHFRLHRAQFAALVLWIGCIFGLYELGNNDAFYVTSLDVQGNSILPAA